MGQVGPHCTGLLKQCRHCTSVLRESFVSGSCGEKILAVFWCTQLFWEPVKVCSRAATVLLVRDSPIVETVLWHSLKRAPGTILSQSLDTACYSNYCSVIWGLPGLWHFSPFPPLKCDYRKVVILSIGVAKQMGGMWALNWARRKEVKCALWDMTCTGKLSCILCLKLFGHHQDQDHAPRVPASELWCTWALANICAIKEPGCSQHHQWWGWWQGQCHRTNSKMREDGRMVRRKGRGREDGKGCCLPEEQPPMCTVPGAAKFLVLAWHSWVLPH